MKFLILALVQSSLAATYFEISTSQQLVYGDVLTNSAVDRAVGVSDGLFKAFESGLPERFWKDLYTFKTGKDNVRVVSASPSEDGRLRLRFSDGSDYQYGPIVSSYCPSPNWTLKFASTSYLSVVNRCGTTGFNEQVSVLTNGPAAAAQMSVALSSPNCKLGMFCR